MVSASVWSISRKSGIEVWSNYSRVDNRNAWKEAVVVVFLCTHLVANLDLSYGKGMAGIVGTASNR